MILVLVDTTGIQPYIFGSNRLGENIGASYLVANATTEWAKAAAMHVSGGSAQILYAGGGNFAVRFADADQANDFERTLSREVLCTAPGLQLVIAHLEYDPINDSLVQKVNDALQELDRLKRERERSAPRLGLSVTRQCRSTGYPAVGWRKEPGSEREPIAASADTLAKDDAAEQADARLKDYFDLKGTRAEGFLFPRDLDDLGRSFGDQSYIAVVHADGNGIGKKISRSERNTEQTRRNVWRSKQSLCRGYLCLLRSDQ